MSYEVNDDIYPASAVIYILSRWGNTYASGTGFLVGKNDVLTAAHVIYDGAQGGVADEIRVYPSYDPDDRNNAYFQAVWVEYYADFDPNSDGFIQIGDFNRPTYVGSEIDIALLALDEDIGTTYGSFGIDPNFKGGSVGVIGYPQVYGSQPTFDAGTISYSRIDNVYLINSDLEVNPGNSGGPIYYDNGNSPYAVGIVSTRAAATSLASHYYWLSDSILENDRFLAGFVPTPTYTVTNSQSFVSEGESARFTLTTTNVVAFTTLTYQITGVQTEDIQNGRLSGTVVVGQDGKATIAIPIKKDLITEGDETLRITIGTANASVVVRDTSKTINYVNGDRYVGDVINGQLHGVGTLTFANGDKYVGAFADNQRNGEGTYTFANGVIWSGEWRDSELMPPVYTLRSQSNAIDEGKTAQFDLIVTNYKSNEVFLYTINGVQAADIVGGQLSGSVTVDTQGRAKVLIPIAADNVTEGPETLTLTLRTLFKTGPGGDFGSVAANVTINDTSLTPVLPTYSLLASSTAVNEGSTATFTLLTTNVAAGTAVAYTLSGVSPADIVGGVMSGTVTVGTNGQATIPVSLAADNLTEGTETLTVTAQGKSVSVTLNDTSTGTAKSESSSIPQGNYTLNAIVDLFGQVLYLKGLRETVASTSHTVEYAGTTFNWSEVDSFVTTVTRDGSFTDEFAKEIADAYPSVAGISYSTAVALVGASAIDSVLIAVAGADGNYVG